MGNKIQQKHFNWPSVKALRQIGFSPPMAAILNSSQSVIYCWTLNWGPFWNKLGWTMKSYPLKSFRWLSAVPSYSSYLNLVLGKVYELLAATSIKTALQGEHYLHTQILNQGHSPRKFRQQTQGLILYSSRWWRNQPPQFLLLSRRDIQIIPTDVSFGECGLCTKCFQSQTMQE